MYRRIGPLQKQCLLSRLPRGSTALASQIRHVSSSKRSELHSEYRRASTADSVLWGATDRGSWTSPHDTVARNPFTKDHARLWTLLEAAIAQGDFKRGEGYLTGLAGIASRSDLTVAVNNFLLKIVELNPENPVVAKEWLAEMQDKVRGFQPNTITEATLLKNLCTAGRVEKVQEYIKDFVSGNGDLKQLMGHVDVLGLQSLKMIVKECNVPLSMVSDKYRQVLKQALTEDEEGAVELSELEKGPKEVYVMDKTAAVPTLKKGQVENVAEMDTFGLKAVRHTLAGLKSDDELRSVLAPHLQNKDLDKDNYVDFLDIFKHLPEQEKPDFEKTLNRLNHKRQQEIEARGYEGSREKWRNDFEKQRQAGGTGLTQFRTLDTLLWEWHEAMLPLVKKELERIDAILEYPTSASVPESLRDDEGLVKNIKLNDRFEYGPYLRLVNPENLPAITMIELLNLNSTGGVNEGMRSSRAVVEVGRTVEQEFRRAEARKREKEVMKGFKLKNTSDDSINATLSELKSQVSASDLNTKHASWPTTVRAKIGSLLIALLLQVARVTVEGKDPVTGESVVGTAPAFYHTYQFQNGNKLGVLKVHKNLAKHLSGEVMASAVQPQLLPMLVKPRPWTAYNKGGYLYTSTKIMRSRNSPEQIAYLKTASDMGQLDELYKGLNVLGETAWTINKDVFEIVLKVWNTGKEFLDIAPQVDLNVQLPPQPPRDCDPSERRDWLRTCRELVNKNQQLFSQRCDSNYKLEIARAFLGERFYFPHNIDFRGRAYPLSPHLNHLGNDMSRGLLMFWEGRELGPNGMRWLKIHIANVCGNSKMNFEERCKYVEENMDNVLDSANNPLDGRGWWKEAESPWQCLAACMELRNALQLGDPTKYVSRVPVHQDGTCNGLQHYAALGGDLEGAQEVNLVPSDKPQDVYTRVLAIVEKMVHEDAQHGVEVAKLVDGRLTRKIVKQTVMTNVYGVTFVGARQQIANKLKDFEDFDRIKIFQSATYLAQKVLLGVRKLFYGAHLIQDWLGDNAALIARSVRLDVNAESDQRQQLDRRLKKAKKPNYMSSVIWTTPMGLPCVQPYREDRKKQVITAIQSVFISDPYSMRGVNARKQRTAFPPNYIHSLDATHMLMSAIGCGDAGIQFASVHDSYWTHAGDVDRMNSILRDAFIELHSRDLIGALRDEFKERYQGLLHLVQIPKESSVGQRVLAIRQDLALKVKGVANASKLTIQDELMLEKERVELLNSSDREQVAKGEAMQTPVTVMESLDDTEVEELLNHANHAMNTVKKRRSKPRTRKSSEFEGNGLDAYEHEQDLSEDGAAAEVAGEEGAEAAEDENDDEVDADHGSKISAVAANATDASNSQLSTTTGTSASKLLTVLTPLRIPQVPDKGEFDVSMLRDSQYFFS